MRVLLADDQAKARSALRLALEAGADAFASKGDPPERLLAAVNSCCHRQRKSKTE